MGKKTKRRKTNTRQKDTVHSLERVILIQKFLDN